MPRRRVVTVAVALAVSLFVSGAMVVVAAAQAPGPAPAAGQGAAPAPGGRAGQPAPAGQAGGRAGGGAGGAGRGGMMAAPVPDDMTGFLSIFDGKTLAGWDGDTKFWRAENGTIVGESTPANRVAENSFLVWRGGTVRDFELKIDVRINGTNSGVQYRSLELPNIGKWVLQGYQADIDFVNQFTGNIHDERGPRFFLSQRGNVVRGVDGGAKKLIATIDNSEALKGYVNINGWNSYHIIARGSTLIHVLNGHLMAVFLDDDAANRLMEGVVGLQMHVGEPFKVEYRNIYLKK